MLTIHYRIILRTLCWLLPGIYLGMPELAAETTATASAGGSARAIVNGMAAQEDAQPWMVALVRASPLDVSLEKLQFCGGTLIDPLWVITAAHCVEGSAASDIRVVIGKEDLEESEGGSYTATEVIIHPDWDGTRNARDVALLRLAQPATVPALPLAEPAMVAALYNQKLTAYGWGNTFDDQDIECKVVMGAGFSNVSGHVCDTITFNRTNIPPVLQKTEITLKTAASCNQRSADFANFYNYEVPKPGDPGYIETSVTGLCGWNETDLSTICYGDSGGPLVGTVNGKQYLVGVVSAGRLKGCQLKFQIGFFADASLASDFFSTAKNRELAKGFEGFCPGLVSPEVKYADSAGGRSRVTLSWAASPGASSYTLYFAPVPQPAGFIGQKSLPAGATEFAIELKSGQRYVVAMRARNGQCEGALSASVVVSVP